MGIEKMFDQKMLQKSHCGDAETAIEEPTSWLSTTILEAMPQEEAGGEPPFVTCMKSPATKTLVKQKVLASGKCTQQDFHSHGHPSCTCVTGGFIPSVDAAMESCHVPSFIEKMF